MNGLPGGSVVKNLPANAGDAEDMGSIPGSERSPGGGNGNPLQYSCLKNPIDRGVWLSKVQRVTKSWAQLSMSMDKIYKYMEIHIYIYSFPL